MITNSNITILLQNYNSLPSKHTEKGTYTERHPHQCKDMMDALPAHPYRNKTQIQDTHTVSNRTKTTTDRNKDMSNRTATHPYKSMTQSATMFTKCQCVFGVGNL